MLTESAVLTTPFPCAVPSCTVFFPYSFSKGAPYNGRPSPSLSLWLAVASRLLPWYSSPCGSLRFQINRSSAPKSIRNGLSRMTLLYSSGNCPAWMKSFSTRQLRTPFSTVCWYQPASSLRPIKGTLTGGTALHSRPGASRSLAAAEHLRDDKNNNHMSKSLHGLRIRSACTMSWSGMHTAVSTTRATWRTSSV